MCVCVAYVRDECMCCVWLMVPAVLQLFEWLSVVVVIKVVKVVAFDVLLVQFVVVTNVLGISR